MSARSPGESERPSAVPAVLAATALVVVLVTWAAAIGPDRVFGGDRRRRETSSEESGDPDVAQSDPGEEDEEDEAKGWVRPPAIFRRRADRWLVVLGYLAACCSCAGACVRGHRGATTPEADAGWSSRCSRPPRSRRPRRWSATPTGSWRCCARAAPATGSWPAGTGSRCRPRRSGSAGSRGRRSSEFTLRVLDLVSADERAVAELSGALPRGALLRPRPRRGRPRVGRRRARADPSRPGCSVRRGAVVTGARWWLRLVVLVASAVAALWIGARLETGARPGAGGADHRGRRGAGGPAAGRRATAGPRMAAGGGPRRRLPPARPADRCQPADPGAPPGR